MLEKYFSQNRCLLISGLLFIYLKDFKTNNHGIFTPEIEKKKFWKWIYTCFRYLSGFRMQSTVWFLKVKSIPWFFFLFFVFFSFGCVLLVYIVAGVLFNKFHRGASGKEVIPNVNFWMDFPLLVKVCGMTARGFALKYRKISEKLYSIIF